jgi:hypothetical protein
MSTCETCIELGEMCHDCKASRPRAAPKPVLRDVVGEKADAAMRKFSNIRKADLPRSIKREREEKELRQSGIATASIRREAVGNGGDQRVAVGCKSGFYNPADAIANAIKESLDPNALPPRRWVPKKKPKQELKFVFRHDGKLNTGRYHGWPLDEVADVNPNFLEFIATLPAATDEDKARITAALSAASERRRKEAE